MNNVVFVWRFTRRDFLLALPACLWLRDEIEADSVNDFVDVRFLVGCLRAPISPLWSKRIRIEIGTFGEDKGGFTDRVFIFREAHGNNGRDDVELATSVVPDGLLQTIYIAVVNREILVVRIVPDEN